MQVKIKKLHPNAKVPTYATAGSGCFDLYAATVNGSVNFGAHAYEGEPITCDTGLAFEIPVGHVMLVFSRSGHGFNFNTRLCNSVGVIDQDFRGSVQVKLMCDEDPDGYAEPLYVASGDRVAQAIIIQYEQAKFLEVEELSNTARGAGGFGSTGSK